jgi:hypothetical protein
MSLMKGLQRWWDELLGRPRWHRDTHVGTTGPGHRPAGSSTAAPTPGELSLADDAAAPKRPRRSGRLRSAGMDPYANDAGFAKPHSWERIDHD